MDTKTFRTTNTVNFGLSLQFLTNNLNGYFLRLDERKMNKAMTKDEFKEFEFVYPSRATFDDETIMNHGMSLRDYFAARALLSLPEHIAKYPQTDRFINIAEYCYDMADAMLEARNK